jgi:hypothetical protein
LSLRSRRVTAGLPVICPESELAKSGRECKRLFWTVILNRDTHPADLPLAYFSSWVHFALLLTRWNLPLAVTLWPKPQSKSLPVWLTSNLTREKCIEMRHLLSDLLELPEVLHEDDVST